MSHRDQKQNHQKAYIVKDIINYKVENGLQWFLIYWEGYPKSKATWETIQSFNPDDDQIVDEMIEPWRKAYRVKQSQEEQRKKNEDSNNRSPIQIVTQNQEQKNKRRDRMWQKLTIHLIEQAKNILLKDQKAKQNLQNTEKASFNQVTTNNKIQQPEILQNNNQSYSQDFDNESRTSKNKKIKKSQQHKKKRLLFSKPQKKLPQMQEKIQGIKQIFERLPVTKIADKISVDGKDLFELQIKYNEVIFSGMYLHSAYISQLWPELLAKFEQNIESELGIDQQKF